MSSLRSDSDGSLKSDVVVHVRGDVPGKLFSRLSESKLQHTTKRKCAKKLETIRESVTSAISENDRELLEKCLECSDLTVNDLTVSTENNIRDVVSLLEFALRRSDIDVGVVEILLNHGADVKCGFPLCWVLSTPRTPEIQLQLVSLLLKRGSETTFYRDNGCLTNTALHAAYSSSKEWDSDSLYTLIDLLLNNGASINDKDLKGNTLLRVIVLDTPPNWVSTHTKFSAEKVNRLANKRIRNIQLIKRILNSDSEKFRLETNELMKIITIALENQDSALFNMLVENGVRVDQVDACGFSILSVFLLNVQNRDCDPEKQEIFHGCIDAFLTAGCDINSRAIDGGTVLNVAVQCSQHPKIVEKLILSGASVNKRDYLLRTPLHYAALCYDEFSSDRLFLLLDNGADVDARDVHGYTPLHMAAFVESGCSFRDLLSRGSNVTILANLNISVMHLVAENGTAETVRILFQNDNSLLEVEDSYGATPLHYAAAENNKETIEELLKLGADCNATDNNGRTALWHARFHSRKSATELLTPNTRTTDASFLPLYLGWPAKSKDDVCKYYDKTATFLGQLDCSADDLCSQLLKVPRLSLTQLEDGENRLICETIKRYVSDLVEEVSHLDARFTGRVMMTGSVEEQVKVGFPDEFDFMIAMTSFNDSCLSVDENIGGKRGHGFATLRPQKTENYLQLFDGLLTPDGYFDAVKFQWKFHGLLQKAVFLVGNRENDHLVFEAHTNVLSSRREIIVQESCFAGPMRLPLLLTTWRGAEYKQLDINFDVVPCIFLQHWPTVSRLSSIIAPELKLADLGVYYIPKWCDKFGPDESSKKSTRSPLRVIEREKIWRVSFSHVEMKLMANVPSVMRQGFVIAKMFRQDPLACCVASESYSSTKMLEYIDSDSDSSCQDVPVFDGIGGFTLSSSSESETHQAAAANSHSDALQSSTESSLAEDDVWRETDFKRPSDVIISYYLKMLFLNEVDSQLRQGITVPPSKMALILYRKLLRCLRNDTVTSYLIPEQNLCSNPLHTKSSDGGGKFKLLVEQIIKLMLRLNFSREQKRTPACSRKRTWNSGRVKYYSRIPS